jgi:outer membrane protein TolC
VVLFIDRLISTDTNKYMRYTLLLLLLFVPLMGGAQEPDMDSTQALTLEECREMARENYPLVAQYGLIEKTADYNVANARRNWLPQVSLSAQATYQSEVMDLELPSWVNSALGLLGMEIEGLHKDQYKAAIEVQQVIWDGGATRAMVAGAKAERELSASSWEVDMYALRERVNGIFFGLLLLQENITQADIYIGELNRNRTMVETYITNGVAQQNDLDMLQVELLGARQQRSALQASMEAYRMMLSLMTGTEIGEEVRLAKPEVGEIPAAATFDNRPEMKLLDAQASLLEAKRKGVNASVMPQLGAFFQGAYGNPGLNLFKDMRTNRWAPYFVAGIKLQWNIGGFYTKRNRMRQINIDYSRLDAQRDTFIYNMRLKSTGESAAIENMRRVMKDDDEIIRLREAIRRRTEAGIENGTKTVNDLLQEMSAENIARRNKAIHEVELLKSIYDLKNTTNQ